MALDRPTATQALVDLYDRTRGLLDTAMAAGPGEPSATSEAAPVLEAEARCLDGRHFDDWIALFDDEACLWIPAHPDDHPGRDQALAFDDRRRMHERAQHMHDPVAWALVSPAPVTLRHLGMVAAWRRDDTILATAPLMVCHVRRGPAHVLHGREVLALRDTAHGLRISAKILVFPELSIGVPHVGWLM